MTRGLGSNEVDLTEGCEVINIGVVNEITLNKLNYPLTGTQSGVAGWKWNKTKPQDFKDIKKRIEHKLGGHSFNLEEGSIESDWFGSVLSGIELKEIKSLQGETKRKIWRPEYNTGVYSIYNFEKRLYSNSSTCEILDAENYNEDTKIYSYQIKNKCLSSTISICLYMRDTNFANIPAFKYTYDPTYSSEYSYSLTENETIRFNKIKEIKVGSEDASSIEELQCKYEHLGLGNVNRGICYTQYYPIVDVGLKTIKNDTIKDWVEVLNFENSTEEDRHYIVDKETGKVIFNNRSPVLYSTKLDSGYKIECNEALEGAPERGTLLIDGVETKYFSKGKFCFYLDSERIASAGFGISIKEIPGGKRLENMEQIYIKYTARPRVDFECAANKTFHTGMNIKPYEKIDSNGLIELSPQEKHVARLELVSDKTLIGRNLYGPLFLQGDMSMLTATALNKKEKAVSEVDVTFYGEEGSFEGDLDATIGIQKITNKSGEAKTAYFYPYSNDALSEYSNVYLEGENSYLEFSNLGTGSSVSDIAIFQVYKTDPFRGSLGRKIKVRSSKKINAFGNEFLVELEDPIGDDYMEYERSQLDRRTDIAKYLKRDLEICDGLEWNTGMCLVEFEYTNHTIGPIRIEKVIDKNKLIIATSKRGQERVMSNLSLKSIIIYKRAELDWSGLGETSSLTTKEKLDRSLLKILYQIDESTNLYKKVKPNRIVGNRLYFDGVHLPESSMEDRDNLIAMYKVMGPKNIRLHARCVDPASGYEIRSNEIKIKVDFPNYLKSDTGFRFKTEDSETSGGLGGANFIAINPDQHVGQLNLHIIND
jgi:hypothetical protein